MKEDEEVVEFYETEYEMLNQVLPKVFRNQTYDY